MHTYETADKQLLKDYAIYVEAKIEDGDMPLTFIEWQDCNEVCRIAFA